MTKFKNVCLVVAPPTTVVKETSIDAVPADKGNVEVPTTEDLLNGLKEVGLRLENDPSINETPAPKAGTSFERSPFNFLPAMTDTEFAAVKEDIRKNGYDKRFPIWKFEGKLLDGLHKDRACRELFADGYTDDKYKPVYREFKGTVREAKEFVARSAKGRNLNPEQLGMIAIHETPEYLAEIIETVKKESKENRKRKPKGSESSSPTNKNPNKRKSKTIVADSVGSKPDIMDTINNYKDELSTKEFDQLAFDIENKITTLKQFEAKRRAEKKTNAQPAPTGNTNEPDEETIKPSKPPLSEKSLENLAGKCIDKVISLQNKRSDVAKEIIAFEKTVNGHNDKDELALDEKQRTALIIKSDDLRYEIKKAGEELFARIVFQCSYKKVVEDDFKEKIPV